VADALTSVLAIVALVGVKYYQIDWLDPFMAMVGAGLIIRWAILLIKDTVRILIQREMDSPIAKEIKDKIESDGDTKICDFHLWQVAQDKYACIISLVAAERYTIDEYKTRLKSIHELTHITIELNQCQESPA